MKKLKHFIFDLIDEDDTTRNKWNSKVGLLIIILIVLSVLAVVLESDKYLYQKYSFYFYWFEVIAVIIFSIEYLLRLWTANLMYPDMANWKARLKYVCSAMAIIDLLAIMPFYITMLASYGIVGIDMRFIRAFRLMRLLRIFKLNRYNDSMQLIGNVLREEREKLLVTIFMTLILLVISSSLIYTVEHEVQPEAFPNIASSMWWSIATLTTVGYGDVYPVTPYGKILAGIIALLGIGLVALPTGILSSSFVQRLNEGKKKKPNKRRDTSHWPKGASRPSLSKRYFKRKKNDEK